MFGLFEGHKRQSLRELPFPETWEAVLTRNVPLYGRLSELDKIELHGHMQVFLGEKTFEGCGGLEMTDEVRVTIAGQACLLLLHRETDYFKKLVTILVYPSAYVAKGSEHIGGGIFLEGEQTRLGEAHLDGVVVLSWDDVRGGAIDPKDGHNVVLHEFAHQLDQEDGAADGAPILPHRSLYAPWARVLGHDFEELKEDEKFRRKTVIDGYGAINPAEFFAVITESFFEKPAKLRKKHPELYEQLKNYYRVDPEMDLASSPQTSY